MAARSADWVSTRVGELYLELVAARERIAELEAAQPQIPEITTVDQLRDVLTRTGTRNGAVHAVSDPPA